MVFAKSTSLSSGSDKLRKKNTVVTNRATNTVNNKTKPLKVNKAPKKYKNKKTTKKSKKINKLLNNNNGNSTDSEIDNFSKPKSRMINLNVASTNNTVNTNSKILDTYDFDETDDSYENV